MNVQTAAMEGKISELYHNMKYFILDLFFHLTQSYFCFYISISFNIYNEDDHIILPFFLMSLQP